MLAAKEQCGWKRHQKQAVTLSVEQFTDPSDPRLACPCPQVEQYVCSRISRNPQARIGGARYLGEFTAEKTDYGFTKGAGFYLPAHFSFLPFPQGAAAATGTAAGS